MYAQYDVNGKITSLIFGNINLEVNDLSYITVPNHISLSSKSMINKDTMEFENVNFIGDKISFQINEATNQEAFSLEIIQ